MPWRAAPIEPERLVADLYESAVDPECWRGTLDRIGDALGGAALVAGLHRPSGMVFDISNRLDPDRHALLVENYVRPETNPLFAAMPRLPVMEFAPREQIMTDESYKRSGLYNDIFRPQGLTHVGVACLARKSGVLITTGLLRRRNREFTGESGRLYTRLLPHLRQAIELTVRNRDIAAARHNAEAAASMSADAHVIVDASGRVQYADARSAVILDAADGLAVRNGRIVASRAPERQQLANLIEAAALGRDPRGGSLRVPRARASGFWAAIVAPLPSHGTGGSRPSALVRLIDLGRPPSPPPRRLRELFGLSPAEARLAAELATGASLDAVAERLGVQITTVRTQLRAVFAKTGTNRQSELIALLARVAGPHD